MCARERGQGVGTRATSRHAATLPPVLPLQSYTLKTDSAVCVSNSLFGANNCWQPRIELVDVAYFQPNVSTAGGKLDFHIVKLQTAS